MVDATRNMTAPMAQIYLAQNAAIREHTETTALFRKGVVSPEAFCKSKKALDVWDTLYSFAYNFEAYGLEEALAGWYQHSVSGFGAIQI